MSKQNAALVADCSSDSTEIIRESVRAQLSDDVEAFLKRGGRVQEIKNNVRADPPKKPTMTYGSSPI